MLGYEGDSDVEVAVECGLVSWFVAWTEDYLDLSSSDV